MRPGAMNNKSHQVLITYASSFLFLLAETVVRLPTILLRSRMETSTPGGNTIKDPYIHTTNIRV